MNREFRSVRQLGFADYFLIVHDVVTAARSHGILVGPGRGSAAGSLVLYCLGVVAVDPLANGLLFERFLDPDRADMPDVDLDFDSDGQAWVFTYLTRRWGADNVARLGTFGYARGRQAVKDAARVLLPPDRRAAVGDTLANRVPTAAALAALLDPANPAGAALRRAGAEKPYHARVLDTALRIDGKVRAEGVHACGVVIAAEPLDTLVPLRRDRRDGRDGTWVTQFDGADITAVGLLKLDVLAIKNLDMVKHAVRLIAQRTGETVDPEQLPTDTGDPRVKATWELIKTGRTAGLFQLASPGMTELARRVGPDNIDDLSVLVALFRPGPLGERMHDRYAERRAGRETVDYGIFTDDPAEQAVLADVLGETLGSIVYQEQMMRLGTVMAGFTPAQSSRLRKAVSKKNPAEMTAVGALFAAGCAAEVRDDTGAVVKIAFSAATATRVWDAMKHAAAFAFNKSHSYAYGTLAYVTAFLKANWPVEYGAALLTVATRDDKRQQAFDDLAADGIDVLPASVNDSDTASTAVDGGAIRLGLAEVKGVGAAAARAVVTERRRNGPFTSLPDLLRRVTVPGDDGTEAPLPADTVDALIEAGACDAFGSRLGLLQIARAARDHPDLPVPPADWGVLERAARERARTGATLTGHPLTVLGDRLRDWRTPGTRDGAGRDLGIRPTPIHRIGGAGTVLTVGLVTDYTERGYSRGRMGTFPLEGSRGRVRCVIWDRALTDLRRRGQVPETGRVAAVRGRITTTRPVTDSGFDDTRFDDTEFETAEAVTAREIMVSTVYPVTVDDPDPAWLPPPGGRITELWTAKAPLHLSPAATAAPDVLATESAVPVPPDPAPAAVLRPQAQPVTEPVTEPPMRAAARVAPAVRGRCAGPVALDLLLLPAGTMLRRAGAGWPGRADLQARYPVLTGKEAAQAIRTAAPGARSGLVPAADESGCYLVVLITALGDIPELRTVTAPPVAATGTGSAVDAASAELVLAAHISSMANKQRAAHSVPVDPEPGPPPMFTLPGQLPPAAPPPDRSPAAPDGPDTRPGDRGAAA